MDMRICQQPSPDSAHSGGEISPLYYQDGTFQRSQRFSYTNSSNSLLLWNNEANFKRKLQDYVAGKTHRKLPELLMNTTNPGYDRMLHNELMDRILPLVSNGKSARFKSEFWFQPEVVGRFYDEGIRVSRTKRDQGILPPLEYIGRPKSRSFEADPPKRGSRTGDVQAFTGKRWQGRHPWHILSPLENNIHQIMTYKEERLASLKPLIDELVPRKPALEELIVVGRNADVQRNLPKSGIKSASLESQRGTDPEYIFDREKTYFSGTTSSGDKESELDSAYTSLPVMFSGCALKVNDEQFFYLSEDTSDINPRNVEIEITFEVTDERPCHKSLTLCNNGSLVIYYEWRLIPKLNAFGRRQDGEQKFFFNASNGIIRPGEKRIAPVSFQSYREGVYGETWAFWTRPCLTGHHPITVRLFGSAMWSQSHSDNVWELETPIDLMQKRATYRMMQRIIYDILKNLQSRKPSESILLLEQTEEEIFKVQNPLLYYTADGVEKLQKLIGDIFSKKSQEADGELLSQTATNLRQWDLSVSTIKQEILEAYRTGLFSTTIFTEFLRRLYAIVDGLSKQPVLNEESVATERYRITYHHIMDCLLKSFDHCSNVMLSMNIDEISHKLRANIRDKWRSAFTKLKATSEFQDRFKTRSHANCHQLGHSSTVLMLSHSNEGNDFAERASPNGERENQQQKQRSAPGKVATYLVWREKSEVLVREELKKTITEIIGIWLEME